MRYGFGIDIGGTSVKVGFFSEETGLLKKWEVPSIKDSHPKSLLEVVWATMEAFLKEAGIDKSKVFGVGMTAPGPISDGLCKGTVNIGWGDVYLGKVAEEVMGIAPVVIENDARVAALGEHCSGAGKGGRSMLMVTLGTGVGGGVIYDGKILSGAQGSAGEIGHMVMVPEETMHCNCGKCGCLEQYASATGMVRVAKHILESSEQDSALRNAEPLTAKILWDEAKNGDVLANTIVDYVCDMLARAIANASIVVDPEMIVIGGGVSAAGDFLLEKVKSRFEKYVFPQGKVIEFVIAQLKNDAGIYGAAALLFQLPCEDCINE